MTTVQGNLDNLLTEIERQQKYTNKLPTGYAFPVFNAAVAIESQRKTAYKTTAHAAREIVDNAIEAGGNDVHVVFKQGKGSKGRNQVLAIAFIDNASGMIPEMARFALSWGGGTHGDNPDFIGKFGFGLPNASINQTKLVEVYTRTNPGEKIIKAWLNLNDVQQNGVVNVEPPILSELPEWVTKYMGKEGLSFEHGTVVVWEAPDRLSAKRPANLKEQLVDDFGVVYRYLLLNASKGGSNGLNLIVEGVKVQPVDPMFLESGARMYESPIDDVEAPTGGGARKVEEWFIAVKYTDDTETGEHKLTAVADLSDVDFADMNLLATGRMHVTIARFPIGFVDGGRRKRGEQLSDARRRFDVRKDRRGISFVRGGREIETVDVFPKLDRDVAQGLGLWPLLQAHAYHWGLEVKFDPTLDDAFGITNDKQSVRPTEDFWRVLKDAGVDDAARRENAWQAKSRKQLMSEANSKKREEGNEETSPAEAAAQDADVASSDRPKPPEASKTEARNNLEDEINRRAEQSNTSRDEVEKALAEQVQQRKYRIDYYDSTDGPFYEPVWVGGVVVVRINRQHQFYKSLYQNVLQGEGGYIAEQAINVLLIALARAELICDDPDMTDWYQAQRRKVWSPFLEESMVSLARRLEQSIGNEEETEEEQPEEVAA